MIAKIFITAAMLLVGFLVVVALQPSEFRIARRVVVAAPPAVVFAEVNDLHRWQA